MMHEPTRFLIVRLSALGDVVQTLPVLAAIRERYPKATVGWLVEKEAADLLRDHPLIDKIHVSDRKDWVEELKDPFMWGATFKALFELVNAIRKMDYQVAIDAQGLFKSSVFPFLAGIPRRIGYETARERADMFYTDKLPRKHDEHDPNIPIYQQLLELTRPIDCHMQSPEYPLMMVHKFERYQVKKLLQAMTPDKPILVMAPFTSWASKNWPLNYWEQLLRSILEELDWNVIVVGSKDDHPQCQELLANISQHQYRNRLHNACGQLSLKELQYLFSHTDMVVGGDSMPLHLAGAVNHPALVGIYGPTSYIRTAPPRAVDGTSPVILHNTQGQLECQPCHQRECTQEAHECMLRITPESVLESLKNSLPVVRH